MEWRYTVSQYYCSMLQSRSKRCEEIAIERTLQASDNVISANEHSGRSVVLGRARTHLARRVTGRYRLRYRCTVADRLRQQS